MSAGRPRRWGRGAALGCLAAAGCAPGAAPPGDRPTGSEPTDPPTTCAGVSFTGADGAVTDHTEDFTEGRFVTFDRPGTLRFCAGTWFVRLVAAADLAIEGAGADLTTLSGGEQGTVVTVRGAHVSIAGVRIDRGRALGGGNEASGGGVSCDAGSRVAIRDSRLTHNHAYDGGAVYAGEDCTVTATDVVFADNSAEDDGGAIGTYFGRRVTLTRAVFERNTARDGGAAFLFGSALEVVDAAFADNVAESHGGAVLAYDTPTTATTTTFDRNRAEVAGALLAGADTTLDRVWFTDNEAGDGGAVFAYAAVTTTGTACGFVANTPDDFVSSGASYVLGEGVDFVCDGQGCVIAD